jgi:hypothetical protein
MKLDNEDSPVFLTIQRVAGHEDKASVSFSKANRTGQGGAEGLEPHSELDSQNGVLRSRGQLQAEVESKDALEHAYSSAR